MVMNWPLRIATLSKGGGVPALAWRFANNTPVKRAEGGFWMRTA